MEDWYSLGIRFFNGDEDEYKNSLKDFYQSSEEKQKHMQKLAIENICEYAIEAHSLKGIARTLGFVELGEIAYAHELNAKDGNSKYVEANIFSLIEKWHEALNEIKTFTGEKFLEKEVINENGKKLSNSEYEDHIMQITECLKRFDCDNAEKELHNLLEYSLPEEKKEKVLNAYKYIQDFEYDKAKKALN